MALPHKKQQLTLLHRLQPSKLRKNVWQRRRLRWRGSRPKSTRSSALRPKSKKHSKLRRSGLKLNKMQKNWPRSKLPKLKDSLRRRLALSRKGRRWSGWSLKSKPRRRRSKIDSSRRDKPRRKLRDWRLNVSNSSDNRRRKRLPRRLSRRGLSRRESLKKRLNA